MAVIYVAFCAAVYFRPQLFFYNPVHRNSNLEVARKNGYPAEQVEYAAADGTKLLAWYTKPHTGRPVIVFMHGNSYNIEKFYHKMIPLMEAGYGTFMPEYRGFGNVPGVITQQNICTVSVIKTATLSFTECLWGLIWQRIPFTPWGGKSRLPR